MFIVLICLSSFIFAQGLSSNHFVASHLPSPSSSWGFAFYSFRRMSGDAGAHIGAVVGAEDLTIADVNAGFEAPMLKVMDVSRVGDKVRRFLYELGATNLADAALLADEEKDVWSCFCEPAGLLATKREDMGQKIAVKKLWLAARKVLGSTDPTSVGSKQVVEDDEAPLPPGTGETLQEVWYDRHKFHLNGSRLVAEGLFNKIYRRVHAKPRKLEPPMLEKVRLQNSPLMDGRKGTFIQGSTVREYEEVHEVVASHHMAYVRMRAIFTTLCYVCVQDPSFYDYGTNEDFCDLLLDLLNRTYSGNGFFHVHPPLAFFQRAYLSMMSDFCQEMRTNDAKLAELVKGKSAWQHYWTGYIPDSNGIPAAVSGSSSSQLDSVPRGVGTPDNASLERQLKEAISMARSAQSQLDRERADARAFHKNAGADQSNSRTDGANGGGKQGGQQQKKDKRKRSNNQQGKGNRGAKRQVTAP